MSIDREQFRVELVDPDGVGVGSCSVARAHQWPGLPHRAFSVLLVDPAGRLLLQRRAATKTRFALRWANACCGHPAPGEPVSLAARRRLTEELGITVATLSEVGVHRYRAEDSDSGRVEDEYDHVLVGAFINGQSIDPDGSEVAEVSWVAPHSLAADLVAAPQRYAPWLSGVFEVARPALISWSIL